MLDALAVAAVTAAILTMLPSPARAQKVLDTTPPLCAMAVLPGPPKQIVLVIQDPESGIAALQHSEANAIFQFVTPFVPGTTDPVVILVTRRVERFSFAVVVLATNGAGLVSLCDPLVTDFEIAAGQKWATQTFTDISAQESVVTVMN